MDHMLTKVTSKKFTLGQKCKTVIRNVRKQVKLVDKYHWIKVFIWEHLLSCFYIRAVNVHALTHVII